MDTNFVYMGLEYIIYILHLKYSKVELEKSIINDYIVCGKLPGITGIWFSNL